MAILIGFAAVVIPTTLQPHCLAGSLPNFIYSVMLAPGTMVANLFLNRGTLDPAFLPLSRLVTFFLFGGLAYGFLSVKEPTI
jgi:hypothetical protein